jgi:hypothetical protein
MSLDQDELDLMDIGLNTIPVCFRAIARQREEIVMAAKGANAMKKAAASLLKQAYISTADSDTADWLGLLAEDYGARRQNGEGDATFRLRIPQIPKGVTRAQILEAIQTLVTAAGVSGTVAMVELPRDMAFAGTWLQDGALTGGLFVTLMEFIPSVLPTNPSFAKYQTLVIADAESSGNNGSFTLVAAPSSGGALYANPTGVNWGDGSVKWSMNGQTGVGGEFKPRVIFTPVKPFAYPPYFDGVSGIIGSCQITFSNCADAGNDGTFTVDGLAEDAILFTNASGVTGTDATAHWGTTRFDRTGASVDGFAMAYCDRGYRAWRGAKQGQPQAMDGIILILPYGATVGLAKACAEALAAKKAAGIVGIVERNLVSP